MGSRTATRCGLARGIARLAANLPPKPARRGGLLGAFSRLAAFFGLEGARERLVDAFWRARKKHGDRARRPRIVGRTLEARRCALCGVGGHARGQDFHRKKGAR